MLFYRHEWCGDRLKPPGQLEPGHPGTDLQYRTLATPLINDGEDTEGVSVGQRIVDKVHAPALVQVRGGGHRTPMPALVITPPDPHPQLQTLEPIPAVQALLVHGPTLPTDHQVDPPTTESRPRLGKRPDP